MTRLHARAHLKSGSTGSEVFNGERPEARTMTPEEREKIYQLARLIHDEQEPAKFSALAEQLLELLDRKERCFVEEQKRDTLS
jgi:hypothetical protein